MISWQQKSAQNAWNSSWVDIFIFSLYIGREAASHFRNKRFVLNKMFQCFKSCYILCSIRKTMFFCFVFDFMQLWVMVIFDIDQDIYKIDKTQSCPRWKMKKNVRVFLYIKYSVIWIVSLEYLKSHWAQTSYFWRVI